MAAVVAPSPMHPSRPRARAEAFPYPTRNPPRFDDATTTGRRSHLGGDAARPRIRSEHLGGDPRSDRLTDTFSRTCPIPASTEWS
jgi:hypothetical protein